jgi:hypothetical protein
LPEVFQFSHHTSIIAFKEKAFKKLLLDHTFLKMHDHEKKLSRFNFFSSVKKSFFSTNFAEEIITKRKTELTTTKQIETRVKRQVKFEDGKVIEDSGPIVSTASKKKIKRDEDI